MILTNILALDPILLLLAMGFCILAIINIKLVRDYEDIRERHHRFIITMMSKKYFAWAFITTMFLFDRYVSGKDDFSVLLYLGFTCTVFGIDIAQKKLGLGKKGSP